MRLIKPRRSSKFIKLFSYPYPATTRCQPRGSGGCNTDMQHHKASEFAGLSFFPLFTYHRYDGIRARVSSRTSKSTVIISAAEISVRPQPIRINTLATFSKRNETLYHQGALKRHLTESLMQPHRRVEILEIYRDPSEASS